MKTVHMVAFALLVVGGLNWGLFGFAGFNLVESLLGVGSGLTKLVYVLVGVSAVYLAATHMQDCRVCGSKGR